MLNITQSCYANATPLDLVLQNSLQRNPLGSAIVPDEMQAY